MHQICAKNQNIIMIKKNIFSALIASICAVNAFSLSAETVQTVGHDTEIATLDSIISTPEGEQLALAADTVVKKRNFIQKFLDYFEKANKPKPYKGLDWNIIGGPHYNSTTKVGLGVVAAGFYRANRNDSITPMSHVSLFGDITTAGYYLLGIYGTNIMNQNKDRIEYDLYFYSFTRGFWGVGYDQCERNRNASMYHENYVNAAVTYLHEFGHHFYVGPSLRYTYAHAGSISNRAIWERNHLDTHASTFSVGFVAQYDSRDNLTATESGVLARLEQRFSPKFLFNKNAFSSTMLKVAYFKPVWKGCVFATQFEGQYSYGNVPFSMLATFGGSMTMRGYVSAHYRDKGQMNVQAELRQHIWKRSGAVVWVGAGTIFSKFSEIQMRKMLPNIGLGYRWEFKKRTNVRLDYGFGKFGENSFMFSINEAF